MTRFARTSEGNDSGFAILTVLGGMLALTLVIVGTATYVGASLPISKRGQDAAAALQAAQAGVDDYLGRVATCDAYWNTATACRTNSVNAALTPDAIAGPGNGIVGSETGAAATGWATIPYSSPNFVAQYHVDEVATPSSGSAVIRIRVTGRIQPVAAQAAVIKRTLVVDLAKSSLLDFIYYTDKEASDPSSVVTRFPPRKQKPPPAWVTAGYNEAAYSGVSPAQAEKCRRYYYGATGSALRRENVVYSESVTYKGHPEEDDKTFTVNNSCDIQFAPIDVIDGKLHTNDAILLNGPLFKGETTSAWPKTATPVPADAAWYRLISGGAAPQAAGSLPKYAAPLTLPSSNASIKDATDPALGGQLGCPYKGPTRVVLKPNGTMDVTSPLTTQTNAGCTTGSPSAPGLALTQNVPLPKNGVIYIEKSTLPCTGKPTAFPLPATDVTAYDCSAGDVFLEGTLSGRLTVATKNDIIVTEDISYAGGATGGDVLGLVAEGSIKIYHPVSCTTTPPAGFVCADFANIEVGMKDVTVSGALLSTQHSITVQNFDRGAKLGQLTIVGGLYQAFRGAVGTGGGTGTGYAKNYGYDKRLKNLPPPSFLNPIAAPWVNSASAEVAPPARCPAASPLPQGCLPR